MEVIIDMTYGELREIVTYSDQNGRLQRPPMEVFHSVLLIARPHSVHISCDCKRVEVYKYGQYGKHSPQYGVRM
jgi:hypothetical protein